MLTPADNSTVWLLGTLQNTRAKFKWLLINLFIRRVMILLYLLPPTLEINPSFAFPSSSSVQGEGHGKPCQALGFLSSLIKAFLYLRKSVWVCFPALGVGWIILLTLLKCWLSTFVFNIFYYYFNPCSRSPSAATANPLAVPRSHAADLLLPLPLREGTVSFGQKCWIPTRRNP